MLSVSKQLLLDTERATELIKKADSCKDTYKYDEYCAELYMILDRYDRYIKSYNNEREMTDLGKDLYQTLGIKSMYEEKNEDTYRLACNGHESVKKYLDQNKKYMNEFRVKEAINEIFIRDTKNMEAVTQEDISDILNLHLSKSNSWFRNVIDIKYELVTIAGLVGTNVLTKGMSRSLMERIAAGVTDEMATFEALAPVALGSAVLAITIPLMIRHCKKIVNMISKINSLYSVNADMSSTYDESVKDPGKNRKTCIVIRDDLQFKNSFSIEKAGRKLVQELNYIKSSGRNEKYDKTYTQNLNNIAARCGDYLEYIEYINLISLTVSMHKSLKGDINTYELYHALKEYLDDKTETLNIAVKNNKLYQALKNYADDKTETDINIIKLEA